jgi:hypothetical protein
MQAREGSVHGLRAVCVPAVAGIAVAEHMTSAISPVTHLRRIRPPICGQTQTISTRCPMLGTGDARRKAGSATSAAPEYLEIQMSQYQPNRKLPASTCGFI